MRCLFVHDNRYMVRGDTVYSEGQFGYRDWRRYLVAYGAVTVAGRPARSDARQDTARLNLSSGPGVAFALLPDVAGPVALVRNMRPLRRQLRDLIAEHDVVIARLPSEAGLVACDLARRLGKPYGIEVVGCPYDALRHYGSRVARAYARIAAWRLRRAVRGAPCVLYVSQAFLQARYPASPDATTFAASNVELTPPGPDLIAQRRARLEAPPERLVVGYCGSFANLAKGFDVVLRALSIARPRLPAFELRAIGPGDPEAWRAQVRELRLEDVVQLHGALQSGAPVRAWMDDLDLLVHAGFQEGVPRTVLEAFSRVCPVVGSSAGGTGEILDVDALHTPGAATELAERIVAFTNAREARIRQATKNAEIAKRFDPERLAATRQRFLACAAARGWRDVGATHAKDGRKD